MRKTTKYPNIPFLIYFFNLREREKEKEGEGACGGGAERKREKESQAVSILSAEPNLGLHPMTLRS